MRDNANKTELFNFLATKVSELCTTNVIYVTREDSVVCNQPVNLEGLSKCNHEEADTRLFVHARHAAAEGRKSIMIKANDTDVLVIGVNVLPDLINIGLQSLWIEFGQGKSLRWIPVNDIHTKIGADKSDVYCSSMRSRDVMLSLPSEVRVRKLHGRHGMFVPMLQMYSQNLASIHQ